MGSDGLLEIEIVYALADEQFSISVNVPFGSTVGDAILQSGLLSKFNDLKLERLRVGIFSKLVDLNARLKDGDRVEIYRPLVLSPAMARRLRANKV